jgi:hypothetical protein
MPGVEKSGKGDRERAPFDIYILTGGGFDIRQQRLSSLCRERHDYLLRATIWALKREAYVAALSA